MNTPSSLLIAYPTGCERESLDLVPLLEHMGDIVLRKYEQLGDPAETAFDVALCIVTDDFSIEAAHRLQKKMDGTPTLVIDQTRCQRIPVNGFAGLTPPSPDDIVHAVEGLLRSLSRFEQPLRFGSRVQLTGRLDTTLSRLGGLEGNSSAMFTSAARQLAHEVRAERAEAWMVENDEAKRVFALNPFRAAEVSRNVVRELSNWHYLVTLPELDRSFNKELIGYLKGGRFDVLAPVRANAELVGWIALKLEKGLLNDRFLDDLNVAVHLLGMVLPTTFPAKVDEAPTVSHTVLSALGLGVLVIDQNRTIRTALGDLNSTGRRLHAGASVMAVRNSRIREMIVEALDGQFGSASWDELGSMRSIRCATAPLPDGMVALKLHQVDMESQKTSESLELGSLISTLPIPVVTELDSGVSSTPPKGRVDAKDANALRRCAEGALESKAKSLRLRLSSGNAKIRGVLFFETPAGEESHLKRDLAMAVAFPILQ